jgi:hypothetical protein
MCSLFTFMYSIYKIGAKFAKRGITLPPFGGSILVPIDTICPCGSLPRFIGVSSDLTRELLPKVVGGGGADILSAHPAPFVCHLSCQRFGGASGRVLCPGRRLRSSLSLGSPRVFRGLLRLRPGGCCP